MPWIVAIVLSLSPQGPESTLEGAILEFANTATQDELYAAIQQGWILTPMSYKLMNDEANTVIASRPFSNLKHLYASSSLGPESLEGLERYVVLHLPFPNGSPTLRFVNQKKTSANLLTKKVGIDAKTATNIWRTRKAGPDHILNTPDDKWMSYELIFGEKNVTKYFSEAHAHSLDEVPGVGPVTIRKIADYAALNGY